MTLPEALISAKIDRPSVITIGTFDGVHVGHQHLVATVVQQARRHAALAVAITFHPRPAEVLRPDVPSTYLCTLPTRVALLRQAGADVVIPLEFTPELSEMTALEFSRQLVEHAHMRAIVGGPDLALGHHREGTPEILRGIGARLHFEVVLAQVTTVDGVPVRSSMVRRAIADGDVTRAERLLGRRYRVEGEVVRGDGRGRKIGVPTANVAVSDKLVMPGNSVYAVYFHVAGERWKGAANVGVRPTFAGEGRSLEVHLLDFEGDLYGRHCEVEFVERLRPERRFASIDELVDQIRADVRRARDILNQSG